MANIAGKCTNYDGSILFLNNFFIFVIRICFVHCRYRANVQRYKEGLEAPLIVPPVKYERESRLPSYKVTPPLSRVLFCEHLYNFTKKKISYKKDKVNDRRTSLGLKKKTDLAQGPFSKKSKKSKKFSKMPG